MSTTKKRSYTHMTAEEFERIKGLMSYGLSDSQVYKITKRSTATLYTIRQSKDFADYQRRIREQVERQKAKRALQTPGTTETLQKYSTEPVEVGDLVGFKAPPSVEQSLATIATELQLLREAWEKPNRKGLFK